MSKLILTLTIIFCAISIQTKCLADYTVTTQEPIQTGYYNNYPVANPSINSSYYAPGQNVNQVNYPNPYQCQYPNSYQYQNPYAYNGYGYGYPTGAAYPLINSGLTGLGATGAKGQIIRNIGQNVLFKLLRGY